VRKPDGRNLVEGAGVDERIILKWAFDTWVGGMDWINVAQYRDRWRTCECGNEPSGSIKCGDFLRS
jgi:hypothetical protein